MSGISRRAMGEQSISPAKIITDLLEGKYFYGRWASHTPIVTGLDGYADPNLADTNINLVHFQGPFPMQAAQYLIGAKTNVGLYQDSANDWLEANPEPTTSEGVEYILGGMTTAANPFSNTIASNSARNRGNKLIRLLHQMETDANIGEMAVGFRKAENTLSVIDNYDEMACINIQYDTDAAYVRIETILNGDPTVTTETGLTLADDTDILTEVRMAGGVPRFFVNGQEFRTSMVFDDGEVIVPFVHFLCNASGTSEWRWKELLVGDEMAINESLQF